MFFISTKKQARLLFWAVALMLNVVLLGLRLYVESKTGSIVINLLWGLESCLMAVAAFMQLIVCAVSWYQDLID